MQRGRYPDKWTKKKRGGALPPPQVKSLEAPLAEQMPEPLPAQEQQPEQPLPAQEPQPKQPVFEPLTFAQAPPAKSSGKKAPLAKAQSKPPIQNAATQSGLICGKNAVLEALRSGKPINRVLLAEGLVGSFASEVLKSCREQGVPFQFMPRARLALIAGPDNRGVACELAPFSYAEVEDMLAAAQKRHEPPLLLLLDGVEDPHNLGAVIRTALCVGAHGVIIPKRRAACLNATVAKTSAGASAHLPVARVANLNQTAQALKRAGLWLAAADMDGKTAWQADLSGPLALVLGGEGSGISPLLKSSCDFCISLPLSGPVASLNVSAAAAALLYEIKRQRVN